LEEDGLLGSGGREKRGAGRTASVGGGGKVKLGGGDDGGGGSRKDAILRFFIAEGPSDAGGGGGVGKSGMGGLRRLTVRPFDSGFGRAGLVLNVEVAAEFLSVEISVADVEATARVDGSNRGMRLSGLSDFALGPPVLRGLPAEAGFAALPNAA
jgi:hypothetical protein